MRDFIPAARTIVRPSARHQTSTEGNGPSANPAVTREAADDDLTVEAVEHADADHAARSLVNLVAELLGGEENDE